jgi:hypothetical protein
LERCGAVYKDGAWPGLSCISETIVSLLRKGKVIGTKRTIPVSIATTLRRNATSDVLGENLDLRIEKPAYMTSDISVFDFYSITYVYYVYA